MRHYSRASIHAVPLCFAPIAGGMSFLMLRLNTTARKSPLAAGCHHSCESTRWESQALALQPHPRCVQLLCQCACHLTVSISREQGGRDGVCLTDLGTQRRRHIVCRFPRAGMTQT
ncbi:hypothetical protein BDW22DRAFT_185174 [Trametopsis cervina]|nr:hypothetical protein BDW22DRAFT_185174 [Trametopsis cervina]